MPPVLVQFHVGAEVVLPWTPPKAKDEKVRTGATRLFCWVLLKELDPPVFVAVTSNL
jgi:hypothetical protein